MSTDSDELIEQMLKKITDEFGIAEEETVTENSYNFKNRTSNMQNDLIFIQEQNEKRDRVYTKKKYGYD